MTETLDYEALAEQAAGNWENTPNFAWFDRPENPGDYAIVYTHHRDSDVLDRANAQAIAAELAPYSNDVIAQHHTHWAVGWIDGYAIKVYDDDGNVTDAFKVWCDLQARIADYPILDESLYSDLEQQEIEESWGCWIKYDFKRELQCAFNVELDADKLWELFHDACEKSGRYPEHNGCEVVVDLEAIVEAVTAEQIRALLAGGAK